MQSEWARNRRGLFTRYVRLRVLLVVLLVVLVLVVVGLRLDLDVVEQVVLVEDLRGLDLALALRVVA